MELAWYPYVIWPAAVFNSVVAVLFLVRWSRRIKIHRDDAWRGLVWLAIGVIGISMRALWRFLPPAEPTVFVSDLDGVAAVLPHLAFVIAFTHWLVHNRRQHGVGDRR